MNYPEQQMLKILNRDLLSNPMYVINNLHIYDWESDFLAITRSFRFSDGSMSIQYAHLEEKSYFKRVC